MKDIYKEIFSPKKLEYFFPQSKAEEFFTALLGDSKDGAYDIELFYVGSSGKILKFEFQLKGRKGRCLKCSLTYGLPDVFLKHPVIDIQNMIKEICKSIKTEPKNWKLGNTLQINEDLHVIPMTVEVQETKLPD